MKSYRRVAFHPERLRWEIATWMQEDDGYLIKFEDGLQTTEIAVSKAELAYVERTEGMKNSVAIKTATIHTAEPQPKPEPVKDRVHPLTMQVGGGHYKDLAIQPIEYITANKLPYLEGNVIKYITRWKIKNGIEDLKKARHYIDILIQMEDE